MHFVIILLALLALFLYLTLSVAKDPEKRQFFYLFLMIDVWLGSAFVYLLVTALVD